jgi:phospholipid transport system substrate-binding protein
VETTILPHFDFARMTRLSMGRNWRLASPEQQRTLVTEFKTLLVHTYSASLAQYRGQKIDVDPLRAAPGATDVTVRSWVKKSGTDPVQISYDLAKSPAGWKVYNVSVDGLIKSLAAKNASNDKLAEKQSGP